MASFQEHEVSQGTQGLFSLQMLLILYVFPKTEVCGYSEETASPSSFATCGHMLTELLLGCNRESRKGPIKGPMQTLAKLR